LILAFGFGNLAMLGWLAAATVPLVIHLWNRRRYREVSWAAMQFLVAAMRRNSRRLQLLQWLLLAVRTLLIVLVVTAFSRPYLETAGLQFKPGRRTHRLLVIDCSYSMAYKPADRSLFTRAQELARQIVDESSQGDGFTLVAMSQPPRVIVGSPAFDKTSFLREIDGLSLIHAGADLPATLATVEQVLGETSEDFPELQQQEVYFLTDLARNTWAADFAEDSQAAALRAQLDELAARAPLVVLDLGQSDSANVAITGLEMGSRFATLQREMTFKATLRNFSALPQPGQLLELWVNQARAEQKQLDLQGGEEQVVTFTHRFERPGVQTVEVRLGGDALAVDNHRWLSVPVKSRLDVLCIGGRQDALQYLVDALDPDRSDNSLVRPQVAPESALVELDLNRFDCIFFSNLAQFTRGEARLLEAYLKQGGGLVFFLGDRVLPDRYNRELASGDEDAPRILPARIGDLVDAGSYRFDPGDYEHPVVSEFRGNEQAGLLSTPIYRYYRLQVPEDWRESDVALRFAGGDPAIVEAPRYRGRSVLVATAASLSSVSPQTKTPWTAMPTWPSFLPIVRELLGVAVGSQMDQYNVLVGQEIGGVLSPVASPQDVEVYPPWSTENPLTVAARSEVGTTSWLFDRTEQSGLYQVDLPRGDAARIPFAVNVRTQESDLRKADRAELPPSLTIRTSYQNLQAPAESEVSRRSGLQRGLLLAALILLFVEQFLARRLSGGAA